MRYLGIMDMKEWKPRLPVRMFSTHQPPRKDTMTAEGKYVYLARNPWDVCVSFFHMATSFSNRSYKGIAAATEDYFNHVALGYALRDEPNVFFLTYEQLIADTRGTVLRLARFIDESYARELEQDDGMLQRLLKRRHGTRRIQPAVKGHGGGPNKYCLVREAKVGSWKGYFTQEQLRRLEAKIREEEKKSSFMDLWKDIREEALAASTKH
ncbi:hypothetical protein HPB48_009846 [Haemaphysalis longicornis]|uniref:Sulfotransferase domain-containing protein n=1 Tax=Haemaphysalis longicornis TaxID=44386 RepID=A0A9J6GHS4_HAELO|nr:hypothetical protein HPB48_009846 [Haemaphysalis longicornis]